MDLGPVEKLLIGGPLSVSGEEGREACPNSPIWNNGLDYFTVLDSVKRKPRKRNDTFSSSFRLISEGGEQFHSGYFRLCYREQSLSREVNCGNISVSRRLTIVYSWRDSFNRRHHENREGESR